MDNPLGYHGVGSGKQK